MVLGLTVPLPATASDAAPDARIHLVAPDALLAQVQLSLPHAFRPVPKSTLDAEALVEAAAAGASVVWIGPPEDVPPDLWIGSFALTENPLTIQAAPNSPLPLPNDFALEATARSAFLLPPKEFPKHNIDEEIRADFLPILEAYDRFGEVVGYPGVLLSHVAPSLAGGRFDGSQCYFFFFDNPAGAMPLERWRGLLDSIAALAESKLAFERVETTYASYGPNDRVQVRARIRSGRPEAASLVCRIFHKTPGAEKYTVVQELRRVAGAGSATEVVCDFRPPPVEGLHRVRVEIAQDAENAALLAVTGSPQAIARRDIGFVLLGEAWKTPELLTVEGPNLVVEGEARFVAGTHYYPSNVWWEWAWRDFRPALAARDFAGMRRAGNRIVRVWVDPVLDEPALRAMDAAVWLAAQQGIVLDVCVFNQWVRDLGFERVGKGMVQFEFRHPADFNLYSFSLRNLELQREYVQTLARRWQRAGNVVYNLANETYIKNPDPSQMDVAAAEWPEAQAPEGTLRDTLLFRRWADEMTAAIRAAGGKQIVFPGYLFSLSGGGDNYLANAHAPLEPWHGYFPPEWIGQTIHYLDPLCTNRPLLLEEFGSLGWNNAAHYGAAMHYALGAGAAGAMSYEWGVSWLSPEAPFVPLPIRDALAEPADPRWFAPIVDYARQNTTPEGVGIAPWPSGFGYGSIYHGTPFPAGAAQAVWRLAVFGDRFARAATPEEVYVVVPEASPETMEPAFPLFEALWLEGARFGTWQASSLDTLPDTARVLLPAGRLNPKHTAMLQDQAGGRARIFEHGDLGWKSLPDLPRVAFSPRGSINCLVRRTARGALYTFAGGPEAKTVAAAIGEGTLELELRDFALAHEGAAGVDFVEAGGEVRVNGAMLFRVAEGRLLAAAEAERPLSSVGVWRILATTPTQVTFSHALREVVALAPESDEPLGTLATVENERTLDIDAELARYVLRVTFADN